MIICKRKSVLTIKKDWLAIEKSAVCESTVYQKFFINQVILMRFLPHIIQNKEYPVMYVVYDDNLPVLIVPLCKPIGADAYVSFGDFNGHTFYDLIYNKMSSKEELEKYFQCFLSTINTDIYFRHVVPQSTFNDIFSMYASSEENYPCVSIQVSGGV